MYMTQRYVILPTYPSLVVHSTCPTIFFFLQSHFSWNLPVLAPPGNDVALEGRKPAGTLTAKTAKTKKQTQKRGRNTRAPVREMTSMSQAARKSGTRAAPKASGNDFAALRKKENLSFSGVALRTRHRVKSSVSDAVFRMARR